MTTPLKQPPRTHQMLSRWAELYARQLGQDSARVRRWVAYMALGGALGRETANGQPRFALKGGVALELRLGTRARATRDLDLVLNDAGGDLLAQFESALQPFEHFTFRLHGNARTLRPDTVRTEVSVEYGGRSWARVPVDVSRGEAGLFEVEMVEVLDLGGVSFGFPSALPCLSLHIQAAQKLHAMTLPAADCRRNTRFRDLLDLVLLIELIDDLPAFRAACVGVFTHRGTHPWPPVIDVPDDWVRPDRALAEDVGVDVADAADAALRVRSFLHRVEVAGLPLGTPAAPTPTADVPC
ncbi:MAG TPA: nucleotidyl transferase AbiEii/AbiGii toxin family protein [Longimicrobium sp.]|nr:nucleotidyl transferase AbiEii/AbiGii toxin family protein [Longimicrobium sp.]